MGKKEFLMKFLAGLFVIGGIVLIVVVAMKVGIEKGFKQPKFEVTVLFRDVAGMTVGAPIRLSGVTVGTVQQINFLEKEILGRGLEVKLSVFYEYKPQLERSTRFAIKTEGILGEKLIDIKFDPDKAPLDLTRPIIGVDPLDVEDSAEIVVMTAKSVKETSDEINRSLKEVQYVTHKMKRLMDRVEQKIVDGTLFKLF